MSFIGRHNITSATSASDIYIVWPINLNYWDTDSDIAVRNANGNHLFVGTINDIRDCVKDHKGLMSSSDIEILMVFKMNSHRCNVKDIKKFISRTYSSDLIAKMISRSDIETFGIKEFKKIL